MSSPLRDDLIIPICLVLKLSSNLFITDDLKELPAFQKIVNVRDSMRPIRSGTRRSFQEINTLGLFFPIFVKKILFLMTLKPRFKLLMKTSYPIFLPT